MSHGDKRVFVIVVVLLSVVQVSEEMSYDLDTPKAKGACSISPLHTVTTILFITVIAFLFQIILKIKRISNQERPKAKGVWPVIGH
uniref:Uncharacterized protein n=1 Tax=Helianthus annuus TaxID=4232 RepID=A0A251S1X6_HELAN